MLHDDLGHGKASQARRVCAEAPLAHFLPEKRARLPPDRDLTPDAIERCASERHVDAERHAFTELHWLRAEIE